MPSTNNPLCQTILCMLWGWVGVQIHSFTGHYTCILYMRHGPLTRWVACMPLQSRQLGVKLISLFLHAEIKVLSPCFMNRRKAERQPQGGQELCVLKLFSDGIFEMHDIFRIYKWQNLALMYVYRDMIYKWQTGIMCNIPTYTKPSILYWDPKFERKLTKLSLSV